jgi:hypothetical protein
MTKIILMFAAFAAAAAFAATVTWDGDVSTDAFDPDNWADGALPQAGDLVSISGTGPNDCVLPATTITGADAFATVYAFNGRSLILSSGAEVETTGDSRDIRVYDGSRFVVEAGASHKHGKWTRIGWGTSGTLDVYGSFYSVQRFDLGMADGTQADGTKSYINVYDGGALTIDGAVFSIWGDAANPNDPSVLNMYEGSVFKWLGVGETGKTAAIEAYITDSKILFPTADSVYNISEVDNYTVLSVVPEPATMVLMAIGGILIKRRRR